MALNGKDRRPSHSSSSIAAKLQAYRIGGGIACSGMSLLCVCVCVRFMCVGTSSVIVLR
jgi:hypothetical protein